MSARHGRCELTKESLKHWLDTHDDPHALIGRSVMHAGALYEVIDFLQEEGQLVLGSRHQESVQEDRYGRAHRLVPRTEMIRLCDEHGQHAHVCEEIILTS